MAVVGCSTPMQNHLKHPKLNPAVHMYNKEIDHVLSASEQACSVIQIRIINAFRIFTAFICAVYN